MEKESLFVYPNTTPIQVLHVEDETKEIKFI